MGRFESFNAIRFGAVSTVRFRSREPATLGNPVFGVRSHGNTLAHEVGKMDKW